MTRLQRTAQMSPWKTSLVCSAVVLALCVGLVQIYYQRALNDVCESSAQTRQVLVDVVDTIAQDIKITAGTDPAAAERVRVTNAQRAEARATTRGLSNPEVCADGVPPVSRGPGQTPTEQP